jgi:hypothetical protein
VCAPAAGGVQAVQSCLSCVFVCEGVVAAVSTHVCTHTGLTGGGASTQTVRTGGSGAIGMCAHGACGLGTYSFAQ